MMPGMIDRDALARLALLMVPGGAGMPSADDIGLSGPPVDRVLEISPHLRAPLCRFLHTARDCRALDDIEAHASADPSGFEALSVTVANAYFMHPDTRAAIGYPGQEARDSSGGLCAADEAMLQVVRSRGFKARLP